MSVSSTSTNTNINPKSYHGRIVSIPHTEQIPMFCLPIVSLSGPNITYCYTINTSAELTEVKELEFILKGLEEALIVIAITILKQEEEKEKEKEKENNNDRNRELEELEELRELEKLKELSDNATRIHSDKNRGLGNNA